MAVQAVNRGKLEWGRVAATNEFVSEKHANGNANGWIARVTEAWRDAGRRDGQRVALPDRFDVVHAGLT